MFLQNVGFRLQVNTTQPRRQYGRATAFRTTAKSVVPSI